MLRTSRSLRFLLLAFLLSCAAAPQETLAPASPLVFAVITHGPIVGGVTDSEAVIFGRMDLSLTTVAIDYGLMPDLSDAARSSETVTTSAASDNTSRIHLAGLLPETVYHFAYVVGDARKPEVYKFRTFPLASEVRDFRFVVLTDSGNSDKKLAPVYELVQDESPAFVMQIGDFDHGDPGWNPKPVNIRNWWNNNKSMIGPAGTGQPTSLSGPQFADLIGGKCADCLSLPFVHIWDDHDYSHNDADKNARRKADATNAFKHYYPLPPLPSALGLWHSFRYAQAEVFVLDVRSQRDPNSDPEGPTKTMLGAEQKQWLKDGLLASTAAWKFIVTPSLWNPNANKWRDSWQDFTDEQNELLDFISSNGIVGVVLLSGDIHSGGALDDSTGLIELSVPHTTGSSKASCLSYDPYCGTWSLGYTPASSSGGYALISVGAEAVTLETRSDTGAVRLTHTLSLAAPTPTPTSSPTLTDTPTAEPAVTETETATATETPTEAPTETATSTLEPSPTETPTPN